MPVVTISRQFGTGGLTLGETLANRLSYVLVDREVLTEIAETAKVSINWVEAAEREPGGLLGRLADRVSKSVVVQKYLGNYSKEFDQKKYIDFLKRVITDLSKAGDMILVGRGGQFILQDNNETVKVLLLASEADRIKFLTDNYGLALSKAKKMLCQQDKARKDFLKRLDPHNPDDPALYDLTFDTGRADLDAIEKKIAERVYDIVDEKARPIW